MEEIWHGLHIHIQLLLGEVQRKDNWLESPSTDMFAWAKMARNVKVYYSKTSVSGHSKEQTTSIQRTNPVPLIDFAI